MSIKKDISVSNSCSSCSAPKPAPSSQSDVKIPLELHACMGLNACKGHDRFSTNDCAGMGYCATNTHVCHTLNNCRGQAGCGLYGDAAEQCVPGANECAWKGSCASPIQAERFGTQGPNAGKSVWLLARKLFEERMKEASRTIGEAPFKCGPPEQWLEKMAKANGGSYDSCGSSGDKYCSFGFNNPNTNAQELCDRSKKEMHKTLKECACEEKEEKIKVK